MASPEHLSRPEYRADIDGLRAVAVLSVVLFHAFPSLRIRGGFVGVDIFFVISGFLISTIIFCNLEKGTFSFTEFYIRRIKRIFPALLLVLSSSLVFGWFGLLADEYEQLGKHILAGALFVSNLVLWGESGYFDNVADSKPLLHLWSLGIEEQFYIFWPLLVWLGWKKKLGFVLITLSALIASFVLNVHGVRSDSVATFYSPLTRFWELSAGSILAYLTIHKHIDCAKFSPFQSNCISLVGMICILLAISATKKEYDFPGWWALLPVVGSMLVIAAGTKAWLNGTILSNRLVVWFGLVSFPLYLWHWPILSFGKIIERGETGVFVRSFSIMISVVLAWLTFRFVEKPIRSSKDASFVKALTVASVVIAAVGVYIYMNGGVDDRSAVLKSGFNAEVRRQLTGPSWKYTNNDVCKKQYPYKDAERLGWWFCMKSGAGNPTLIILGNSFANQLYVGFARNSALNHHTLLNIGTRDFGEREESFDDDGRMPCDGYKTINQVRFIDDLVAKENAIRFAVIGGLCENPDIGYIERVRKRIDYLESKGIRVIVFTPHLMPGYDPKACFTAPLKAVAKDCTFHVRDRYALYESFKPLIDSIARTNPSVRFFEQNEMYCRNELCSFVLNGLPLHRDGGHLSEFGSVELQRYFTSWAKENIPEIFEIEAQ